jgi:hypothetical protein
MYPARSKEELMRDRLRDYADSIRKSETTTYEDYDMLIDAAAMIEQLRCQVQMERESANFWAEQFVIQYKEDRQKKKD